MKEPRGQRRKRETRTRLLEAALQLMARKGMEGVAINEITEAADVGFGSFYNHFESKEAIHAAVMEQVFEGFADAIDRLVKDVVDPAEVIAISVRHTLRRARREPTWGQFLIRECFSGRVLERGLGQRLLRDIRKGVASKRFLTKDPLVAFFSIAGTVMACISADLEFGAEGSHSAQAKALGFDVQDIAERTAAVSLRLLGLEQKEADVVARRALPVVEIDL